MMHILCSTDGNYIMPTGVMIKSVSVNNIGTEIVFHILVDDSVTIKQKNKLRSLFAEINEHTLSFHEVGAKAFASFPGIGTEKKYISKATYYRLLAVDILANVDKVLYLDCDIVVDGSLAELWNYDMEGYAVGVVTDMSENIQNFHRLGYPSDLGYFNAGVSLINLKYWRENNAKKRFVDLMINHPEKIVQHDQDVLNIVFAEEKFLLPFKYNVQNGFLYKNEKLDIDFNKYKANLDDARENYVVIHFTTWLKPWHKDCIHPLKDIWLKYYKQTGWPRFRLKRRYKLSLRMKLGNVLRFFKLLPPLAIESPYMEL